MTRNPIGRPPKPSGWAPHLTIKPPKPRITPDMVKLFRRACVIEDERSPEYIEVSLALHRLLGRKPWHVDVLDIDPDDLELEKDPNGLADMIGAARIHGALLRATREQVARKRRRALAHAPSGA